MNCLEGFGIDTGRPPAGRQVRVSRRVHVVTTVCTRGRQFPGVGVGMFRLQKICLSKLVASFPSQNNLACLSGVCGQNDNPNT